MARPSKTVESFFRRYPWIRPALWLLVGIWSIYLIRKPIFYVKSLSWGTSKIIFEWWYAILKTLLHLASQLCIAVPGTALVYIVIVYGAYPLLELACARALDLLTPAPAQEPRLFQYTHTHSDGETVTHMYTEDEIEQLREAVLMQAMAEMREQMQREQAREQWRNEEQEHYPKGAGKAKRKANKRNRNRHPQ